MIVVLGGLERGEVDPVRRGGGFVGGEGDRVVCGERRQQAWTVQELILGRELFLFKG